jgi:hypothetical protein
VSGAPAPYGYLWSNLALSEDLNSLLPGNYSVTVTGANQCTAVSSVNVPDTNVPLNITSVVVENTACGFGNGSLDISVSPAGTYSYAWSNVSFSEDLANLGPGTYTVTVTWGTCTANAAFVVADNAPNPVVSSNVIASLCSQSNGSIDLNVTGPAAPFSYLWSNNETSEDLSDILSGPYSVTVTASNGCTTVESFNVPNNASTFSLAGSAVAQTNCAVDNGTIDLTVTPSGAYTILWSNGAVTEDLSGVPPGTYTVSVTESGNCTATASYVVNDQRVLPVASSAVNAEICGLANGSIDLSVSSGTSPYFYDWSSGQNVQDLTNIPAGSYIVTVTDANNCTVTVSATVPDNPIVFALSGNAQPNTSCLADNGSVSLNLNPANGTYTYLWSNAAATPTLTNLAAGTYTVTVSAGGTCTSTASFLVDNNTPAPNIAQSTDADFCGQASGGIDLTVANAPAPFSYQWSNLAVTEDLTGILSGTYTVTVTAANGCTSTRVINVAEDVFVPAINSALTDATSCVVNNGAIDLSIAPAGAYTFTWSNSSVTEDLSGIAAGTYTVTVSAGGSCTNTATFLVNSNTGVVTMSGQTTAVLCFGANTGAIDLTVTSGTAPFLYNWSNLPGNPEDPANLTAGTYTVTVTDLNGCTNTQVFVVAQPNAALQLQCSVTNLVSEPGFTDGSANVNIGGGTGPYLVQWAQGSSQNPVPAGNFPLNNLGENNYAITVTDANGCPSTCDFAMGVANCATVVGTMSAAPLSACGTGCLTATYNPNGQVLGPNDLVQFILHQGNGAQIVNEITRSNQPTFCFDPNTMSYGTTYYISAVAGTGSGGNVNLNGYCTVASQGTPIQFFEIPTATATPPASITCATAQVILAGSSSLPNASYLWSTANGSIVGSPAQATVTASAAGTYALAVTVNGCSNTATVAVTSLVNSPQVNITSSTQTLDCVLQSIMLNGKRRARQTACSLGARTATHLGTGTSYPSTAPALTN